ncbi:MAG: peptidase S10 [Acidobacteria bacterium]|nr:peptidase S10 [Acidobacteriota bacterium]
MRLAFLLLCFVYLSFSLAAQPPGGGNGGGRQFGNAQATPTPDGSGPNRPITPPEREEPPTIKKHSINVGGKQIDYTTTTGFMPIKNAVSGETEARMFFIAYTMDNAPAGRPLMFSFNGGPGSASVWLHLGALGPRRIKMMDDGMMPPPPYQMEDNQSTWLADSDLVFIDPVGTGYSRATRPELAAKFFGVNGDIDSVGEFIRMYLGRNDRWMSPLFLVGESYGTTRASGLSNWLFNHGIALNGITLISTVMNFETISFADNNDLPLIFYFPSYATTAWYHKKLSPEMQRKPVAQVAKEATDWAIGSYAPAMMRIDSLSAQEKHALAENYSKFTGMSPDFVERGNFRIELGEFSKELLRGERRTTGRLDSRFKGIERDALGSNTQGDPSNDSIRPPYTAAFNSYVRGELGYRSDVEYYILGGGITAPWNYGVTNGYADTSIPLKDAMNRNPFMKVMIACGYYDMATPFAAAEYTVSAMNLDPTIRRNINFNYYEAGHMMYIDTRSLKKLHDDEAAFISAAVRR